MKVKLLALIASFFFLSACSSLCAMFGYNSYVFCPKDASKLCRSKNNNGGYKEKIFVESPYANEENAISLQHPRSRVIVHCYTTATMLAETCAQIYERADFVRFREIPYKTADYDFLKHDSFPTRRWRRGERTPRW